MNGLRLTEAEYRAHLAGKPNAEDVERKSEREFQREVIKRAGLFGWLVYHTRNSRGSNPGFPDLVLVHRGKRKVIFAELKTEKGKLSKEQQEWIDALMLSSGDVVEVWRPSMMDRIVEVLR